MKEKVIAYLLLIAMTLYFLVCFRYAHEQWKIGISKEECVKEEMLIW